MSSKFKEILHQAKEAKNAIGQVIDDVDDVVNEMLNVDPSSIPRSKLTVANLVRHIDMGIMSLNHQVNLV